MTWRPVMKVEERRGNVKRHCNLCLKEISRGAGAVIRGVAFNVIGTERDLHFHVACAVRLKEALALAVLNRAEEE